MQVKLTVNGKAVEVECESRTLLVHLLRDHLRLTGTHIGCDTTQCGACVVHLDGRSVKSCTILAAQAGGSEVTTIEGLSDAAGPHPVQSAFKECHALQCGFCTPGMIMACVDIIRRRNGQLTDSIVRHDLEGNICRCTGYANIVEAALLAAEGMKDAALAPDGNQSNV